MHTLQGPPKPHQRAPAQTWRRPSGLGPTAEHPCTCARGRARRQPSGRSSNVQRKGFPVPCPRTNNDQGSQLFNQAKKNNQQGSQRSSSHDVGGLDPPRALQHGQPGAQRGGQDGGGPRKLSKDGQHCRMGRQGWGGRGVVSPRRRQQQRSAVHLRRAHLAMASGCSYAHPLHRPHTACSWQAALPRWAHPWRRLGGPG